MTSKTCPACGKEAEGRFCSWCGSTLGGVHCTACGAEAEPGARFCNKCGAALAASTAGPATATASEGARVPTGTVKPGRGAAATTGDGTSSRAVWWLAGTLMVALILAVVIPVVRGNTGGEGAGGMTAPPATGPGAVDLSSMTPRQAADQLFGRIMQAAELGDTGQVMQFYPMGVQAYEMARPLDADGLFHLALIHQVGGDNPSALAAAEEALAVHPNHLLNLSAAAASAAALGDTAAAREHYGRLVDQWDGEMAKELEEYEAHSAMMPDLLTDARAFLAGSEDGGAAGG